MTAPPAIGGVFAAEPSAPPVSGSVWDAWRAGWPHAGAFANARSALRAVLKSRGVRRAWLPAYICGSLADGVRAAGAELAFYPVGPGLEADVAIMERGARTGDAVVAVDYFGRAEPDLWRPLIAARPDLLVIEDRAQALDPGAEPLAEAVLYSPRKLLGVADGGLVFTRSPTPPAASAADPTLWSALDARAADPQGHAPERWRPLYVAAEDSMCAGDGAATDRSLQALDSTALAPIAAARRANWRRLAGELEDWALFPVLDPTFAPLAFPILTTDAAAAVVALAAERIWAPRHWATLPSDPAALEQAHRLAATCVSLPLDQRYGEAEMTRLAEAVKARVPRYPR
jgi:dTDP-4-amino-4,6-dideoxygalactose transaminase